MGKASRELARAILRGVTSGPTGDLFLYKDDPIRYAEEVLGVQLWSKQVEIARALVKNRIVVVDSGHGTGKSFLAAVLVNWFYDVHTPVYVVTTAPSWNSVKATIWRNVRRLREARGLPGRINKISIDGGPSKLAEGLSTRDEGRFIGRHDENMLFVIDEGPEVPDVIFMAIESCAVGDNNKIISIGNPTGLSTYHQKLKSKPGAVAIRISTLEHPNVVTGKEIIPGGVTRAWVDEHVREWCEPIEDSPENAPTLENGHFYWSGLLWKPSPIAMSKILGLPPKSREDQVVSYELVSRAIARRQDHKPDWRGLVQVGVDIAYTGSDESVLFVNAGGYVLEPHVWRGMDTISSANIIWEKLKEIRQNGPRRIRVLVDQGGVVGVVDQLKSIARKERASWVEIVPVYFGGAPADAKTFTNMRAELYWRMRDAIRDEKVSIPNDTKLIAELIEHRYFYAGGRIQIESKESVRSRLGRSPDRADALALALYDGNIAKGDWLPGVRTWLAGLGR